MSVCKEGGWQLREEAETVTHPLKDLKDSQMNRKGPWSHLMLDNNRLELSGCHLFNMHKALSLILA